MCSWPGQRLEPASLQARTSLAQRCCDGSATLTLPSTVRAHPVQVIKWVTPCLYGPSTPGLLRFWLGELNHCLAPWIMLLSLAYPLPLKVGAWAVLACAFRRHHNTLPLGRAAACMPVYRTHGSSCGSAASSRGLLVASAAVAPGHRSFLN